MNVITLIGRAIFALAFIYLGISSHFSAMSIGYAEGQGVPMASILVPFSGIMAVLGGISVLLGYKAKIGAWILILFLLPVTFMMHNFWAITDPMAAMMQKVIFLKNLSMMGGALMIARFGAGPLSLDARVAAAPIQPVQTSATA